MARPTCGERLSSSGYGLDYSYFYDHQFAQNRGQSSGIRTLRFDCDDRLTAWCRRLRSLPVNYPGCLDRFVLAVRGPSISAQPYSPPRVVPSESESKSHAFDTTPNYVTRIPLPVNKYGNRKTVYDAFQYDSKAEAEYAKTLNLLRHAQGKDRVELGTASSFPVNGERRKDWRLRLRFAGEVHRWSQGAGGNKEPSDHDTVVQVQAEILQSDVPKRSSRHYL
jgi:hypothetical protein